jgi:hypothetical protein
VRNDLWYAKMDSPSSQLVRLTSCWSWLLPGDVILSTRTLQPGFVARLFSSSVLQRGCEETTGQTGCAEINLQPRHTAYCTAHQPTLQSCLPCHQSRTQTTVGYNLQPTTYNLQHSAARQAGSLLGHPTATRRAASLLPALCSLLWVFGCSDAVSPHISYLISYHHSSCSLPCLPVPCACLGPACVVLLYCLYTRVLYDLPPPSPVCLSHHLFIHHPSSPHPPPSPRSPSRLPPTYACFLSYSIWSHGSMQRPTDTCMSCEEKAPTHVE